VKSWGCLQGTSTLVVSTILKLITKTIVQYSLSTKLTEKVSEDPMMILGFTHA